MKSKLTAAVIVTAAILTNVGFTMLGSIFNYPDVLKDPTTDILSRFREHQSAVTLWFAVLAMSAAMFAPIAIGVGKLRSDPRMQLAVRVGVAAATVQTIGLARWILLVPGFAHDAASGDPTKVSNAENHFHTAHVILGNIIGETFGYILTAAWTWLVVASLGRAFSGRAFSGRVFGVVGRVSAVMILVGVLSPLDLAIIDTVNFAGYVIWSVWLIGLAVGILRSGKPKTVMTQATDGMPGRL
jgi:Domain of unknown function (DUF4386)